MAQRLQAGQLVPESGIYRVTHGSAHVGAQNEITFIRGRRFPTCSICDDMSFELVFSDEAYWLERAAARRARSLRHRWRKLGQLIVTTSAAMLRQITAHFAVATHSSWRALTRLSH